MTIERISLVAAVLLAGAGVASAAKPKPVKVPMSFISAEGAGKAAGTVTLTEGKDGVTLQTDLKGLPAGEHGFHVHENGSCDAADKDGKKVPGQAAGGHFDPDGTKAHKGPEGGGHKGDLPKLEVPESGAAKVKLQAKGLKLADLQGKALMIHAGGDNYSDTPKPSGGGGDRIICGVIPPAK